MKGHITGEGKIILGLPPTNARKQLTVFYAVTLAMMTTTNILPRKGLGQFGKTFVLIGSMHT